MRRLLARSYWALSRWTLQTQPPAPRPAILIGAPHTSNWDFVLMLAIVWHHGLTVHWLGKKSLFAGPAGPVMRALGGIPVDRAAPQNLVAEITSRIRAGETFSLVIAPEGTRKATTYWKSGFYRIAQETGMPVTLGYVDRTTMTTGLGPTLEVTGNASEDMRAIRAFYADKAGVHPAHRSTPRLRDEDDTTTGR